MRPVVQRSEHHRLVRIAALEHDDDFHSDSRDELMSPRRPCPGLHRPDPARALLVVGPLAIPVELNLDLPPLVDVDLLACGSHDRRGERDLHAGALGPRRHVRHLRWRTLEGICVDREGLSRAGARLAAVLDAHHHVGPVEVRCEVLLEREAVADAEIGAAALARRDRGTAPLLAEDARRLVGGEGPLGKEKGAVVLVDLGGHVLPERGSGLVEERRCGDPHVAERGSGAGDD